MANFFFDRFYKIMHIIQKNNIPVNQKVKISYCNKNISNSNFAKDNSIHNYSNYSLNFYYNKSLFKKSQNLYFGLNSQFTTFDQTPEGCSRNKFNHSTSFFRNEELLEFTVKYLNKFFPQGTHIANYGCSDGSETRSIVMLLNEHNKNNKYTITGYEISESKVEEAKKGSYQFENDVNPANLVFVEEKYDRQNKYIKYRQLFQKFFQRRKKIEGELYLYEAKKDLFENIIDFEQGNINEISDKKLKEKNTGAVIFKNAWYHISNKEKILKDIYHILPDYGLLIVGCHGEDHNDSSLQDSLQKAGFTPIRYEEIELSYDKNKLVPSAWAKIPEGKEKKVKRLIKKL